MLLTEKERDRFAHYLEICAESSRLIVKQMEKIGPHGEELAKREKTKVVAYLIVAADLRTAESMSIGNPAPEGERDDP